MCSFVKESVARGIFVNKLSPERPIVSLRFVWKAGPPHDLFSHSRADALLFLSDPDIVVGSEFFDSELGWCDVTGWGIYTGPPPGRYPSYFYVPKESTDRVRDELFSSEQEVLAWIQTSPARIPDGKILPRDSIWGLGTGETTACSTASLGSTDQQGGKSTGQSYLDAIASGLRRSSRLRGPISSVGKTAGLLYQKVLRRILAAKESLFKFGAFVPKN